MKLLRSSLLFCLCLLLSIPAVAWELRYLGQQALPFRQAFGGGPVGGLSGLEYDAQRDVYYVISDDRSDHQAARFYTLTLNLERFNTRAEPGHEGVELKLVTTLLTEAGQPYAHNSVDPEAIRLAPGGRTLLWSSEGMAKKGIPPHLVECDLQGRPLRSFALPAYYLPTGRQGVRANLAFEAVAVAAATGRVYVATENALEQDGPTADDRRGSPSRVLMFDHNSGRLLAEYVYMVEPAHIVPRWPALAAMNGLAELLHFDGDRLLALERAYSPLAGSHIRLYLVDFSTATDVRGIPALADQPGWQPARKQLLLDLNLSGLEPDNLEGMTWGPPLPNGHRRLVLVADDNFNPLQKTQFMVFELLP